MNFKKNEQMQFPLVEIELKKDQMVYIQPGSMVYHSPSVKLNATLNATGSGVGKLIKAVGRSVVSGESTFVTQAIAVEEDGQLALAPSSPGEILALDLGTHQYCLNDGAFLALDGSASYKMKRQSIGRALFGGQGGLFVMSTEGEGSLLANAFGSIKKIELKDQELTVDNAHVVAWSQGLDYQIHLENGFWRSIGNGEGLVNTFKGTGEIYIQSLNLETFAGLLGEHISVGSN